MANVVKLDAGGEGFAARIEGDALVLDDFYERDAQVVRLATEAENIDALVHDCLVVGARALGAAQVTTDVAVVEKAFGDMTSAFSSGLEDFAGEFDAKTKELLDAKDGVLPHLLEEFKEEMDQLLGDAFDPDSKVSALAKIEHVMQRATVQQVKAVRSLIDPENEESPLGRYRSEIVKAVEKETKKVHEAVEDLKTQFAVQDARAEVFELTTKKGFTFEDELESKLIDICGPHSDVAERVGGTPGAHGKKGDFRILVNPEDTGGQEVCFVIEAKNSGLGLRDTLKELDRCMANRGALAGVVVFAKNEQCPGDAPFQFYGNRAVVVYDASDGDDLALRLACAWARWVVRRQLGAGAETIDFDRIGALIDNARQALRTQSTIDRALTTSANKIGEAKGHLGTLVDAVESALAAIEGEIAA